MYKYISYFVQLNKNFTRFRKGILLNDFFIYSLTVKFIPGGAEIYLRTSVLISTDYDHITEKF